MKLTNLFTVLLAKAQAGLFPDFETRKTHLHQETTVDKRGRVSRRWLGNEAPAAPRKTLPGVLASLLTGDSAKPVMPSKHEVAVTRGQGELFGAAPTMPAQAASAAPKVKASPKEQPAGELFNFDFTGQTPAPAAAPKAADGPAHIAERAWLAFHSAGERQRSKEPLYKTAWDATAQAGTTLPAMAAAPKPGQRFPTQSVKSMQYMVVQDDGRLKSTGADTAATGKGYFDPVPGHAGLYRDQTWGDGTGPYDNSANLFPYFRLNTDGVLRRLDRKIEGKDYAVEQQADPHAALKTAPTKLIQPTTGDTLELRKRDNGDVYVWQNGKNTFDLTKTGSPGVFQRQVNGNVTVYRQKGDTLHFDRHHPIVGALNEQTPDERGDLGVTSNESHSLNSGMLLVGATKVISGVTYRLNKNHRWERADDVPQRDVAGTPDESVRVWHRLSDGEWKPDRISTRADAEKQVGALEKQYPGRQQVMALGENPSTDAAPKRSLSAPLTPDQDREEDRKFAAIVPGSAEFERMAHDWAVEDHGEGMLNREGRKPTRKEEKYYFQLALNSAREHLKEAIEESKRRLAGPGEAMTPEAAHAQLQEAMETAQAHTTPEAVDALRAAVKNVAVVTGQADGDTPHTIATSEDTEPEVGQRYLVGLPDGVKDKQRRKWNDAAAELIDELRASPRETTEAERQLLARYSGNGGIGASLNEYYTPPELGEAMWAVLDKLGSGKGRGLEPSSGPGVLVQFAPDDATMDVVELSPLSAGIANVLFGHRHDVHTMSFEAFNARNPDAEYKFATGNPPFCPRDHHRMLDERYQEVAEESRYFTLRTLDRLEEGGIATLILPAGIARNKNDAELRARILARAEIVAIHGLPTNTFSRAGTESATTDLWVLRARPKDIQGMLDAGGEIALRAAGVHDEEFVTGRWHQAHPEQMHATVTKRAGIGGAMMYARDGELSPELLSNLVTHTPVPVDTAHPTPEDLAELLKDYPKALAGWYAQMRGKEGDTRTTVSGQLQMCMNGRWHNIGEHTKAAITAANGLSDLINMHATQISHEDWDTANGLRPQLENLLKEYLTRYGNPHQDADLQRAAKESAGINNLLAVINKDGSLADTVTKDAQSRAFALDKTDMDSVATYLRREKQDLSTTNVRRTIGADSDRAAAETLMGQGYCYSGQGNWKAPGDFYSGESGDVEQTIARLEASELPEWARLACQAQRAELDRRVPRKSLEELDFTPRDGWVPIDSVLNFLANHSSSPVKMMHEHNLKDYYITRDEDGKYTVGTSSDKSKSKGLNIVKRYLTGEGRRTDEADLYADLDDAFADWAGENDNHRLAIEEAYRARGTWLEPTWDTRPVQDMIPGWRSKAQGGVDLHPFQSETIHRSLQQGNGIMALDVGLGKTPTAIALTLLAREQGLARKPVVAVPKSVVGNWREKTLKVKPDAKILVVGAEPKLGADGVQLIDEDGFPEWSEVTGAAALDRQLAQMKTGDYDMVLMTHTTLGRVQFDPVQQLSLIESEFYAQGEDRYGKGAGMGKQQFEEYTGLKAQAMIAQGDLTLEGLQAASSRMAELDLVLKEEFPAGSKLSDREKKDKKKKKEERARLLFMATAYRALSKADSHPLQTRWNELGVDHIVVDEGHSFKGLWAYAQGKGSKTVKYLGAPQESSQRAVDLYYKTKAMRASNDGRGVYLLTATPIKNSPVELFSMLSYTAPQIFKKLGIHNLDQFIDRYCRIEQTVSVDEETGEASVVQVLAGLKNLSELRREVGRVINRKTAAMVGLPLPHNDESNVHVEPNPEQADLIKWVAQNPVEAARLYLNADVPEGLKPDDEEYAKIGQKYALAIPHITRRAELDMELIDPVKYRGYVSPKVRALLDELKATVGQGQKAVVFSDVVNMPAPHGSDKRNPNGYSFHEKLRRLIAEHTGLKPEEIAIVNAQTCPKGDDRLEVARGLKSGKYKVVLGNTGTMGEGINLQHGVQNLLHLDVPWNPAVWQQRVGRVVRQGNTSKSVNNKTFLGTRGLDKDMYDTLKGKGVWYDEFWNGESDSMDAEGGNDYRMTPERLAALALDDPAERTAAMEQIKHNDSHARTVGQRLTAIKTFSRFQAGSKALSKMQANKSRAQDKWTEAQQGSLDALQGAVGQYRARLEKHPGFAPYLHALDNPAGAILDAASGRAFTVGERRTFTSESGVQTHRLLFDYNARTGMVKHTPIDMTGAVSNRGSMEMHVSDIAQAESKPWDQAAHVEREVLRNGMSAFTVKDGHLTRSKHLDAARRGMDTRMQDKDGSGSAVVLRGDEMRHVSAHAHGTEQGYMPGDQIMMPGHLPDTQRVSEWMGGTYNYDKHKQAKDAGFEISYRHAPNGNTEYYAKADTTPLSLLYTQITEATHEV